MGPLAFADERRPRRLAFVFFPNGIHMQDWTPRAEGPLPAEGLPYLLEPLAGLRGDISILTGLAHGNARALGDGPGDHARSAACFLTGAHPLKTSGADLRVGVSVDQVAADAIGAATRFPSLELGTEPALASGSCDSGYACAYSSNVAWRTARTPMGKEISPRRVFDRLFAVGPEGETPAARAARLARRRSVLDFVREDAGRLDRSLGVADRRKLDEYLTGVRELEARLDRSEQARDDAQTAGVDRPTAGVPRDYAAHVGLMYDLMILAFRLDLTRVTTFMVANEGSNRNYGFCGAPGGHHELSHHRNDPEKVAGIRRIDRWHMEQFAAALQRMKGIEERGESLLDSTMLVFGSAISDGNRHNHDDLPVLLAGRGGGALRPGRHVRWANATPMCNLYVSVLNHLGIATDRFGDSTGALEGL